MYIFTELGEQVAVSLLVDVSDDVLSNPMLQVSMDERLYPLHQVRAKPF